eukprot:CAMPEP_0178484648 /NCGR_PEP_ID=MMETSP0696-20121128/7862_1 /TAXON_ID=265572 /ORGANISM="Extubocellulus spinifer, Strain CCMP396" /LENGTH=85 /DNA_ID=CAMNT_0020112211 /DNA_START=367 /DNA_END=624 /DNA_ORIENTATION=+
MAHPPSKTSKKRFKASLVDLDPLARYRRHHIPAGGMLAITPETHPNPGIGKTTPLETPIPWYTHINVIPYTYTDHGIRWWAPDGA